MERHHRRYELRHLRYFVALAEELHFGRAAQRLALTQPPLSFNIKQLEETFGTLLFKRDNKGVELTPAGRAFLPEARAVLAQAQRGEDIVRAVSQGLAGLMEIGFSGSMIYMGLPRIVASFEQRMPAVDLRLREFGLPDQVERLLHGRLDAGFVDATRVPEGLDGDMIGEEPYMCCVPTNHRLARMPAVHLKEIASDRLVICHRDGSPAAYDRIVSLCMDAGFEPNISHAVRQWFTIIALVSEGIGVALVPARMARSGFANVSFVPIRSHQPITSTGYLLWNPKKVPSCLALLRVIAAEIEDGPEEAVA